MIARIFPLLLLIVLLPPLWFEWRERKRKPHGRLRRRIMRWTLPLAMCGFTIYMAMLPGFVPDNRDLLLAFFIVLSVLFLPRLAYTLCSIVGHIVCRITRSRTNWGNLVGLMLGIFIFVVCAWGFSFGPRQIVVRHVTLSYSNLPKSFDGYRIVHVTDLHLGGTSPELFREITDSILSQQADIILFTGDIQNTEPQEIYPHMEQMARWKAKDGVLSVMGNHDYSLYANLQDEALRKANEFETMRRERDCHWNLLLNEHRIVTHNQDTLLFVGCQNDGAPPFPSYSDMAQAMQGVPQQAFTIMLQHDPSAWRRSILPQYDVDLTLSGHTHGGQFQLFGWHPTSMVYQEEVGLYTAEPQIAEADPTDRKANRRLYVSTGAGSVVPFRFNLPPEIVVITLRCSEYSAKH